MKRLKLIPKLLFFMAVTSTAAGQQSLSGCVVDRDSESPLAGVHLQLKNQKSGTVTDQDGIFLLSKTPGLDTLMASFQGYQALQVEVDTGFSGRVFYLQENSIGLSGINVMASAGVAAAKAFTMHHIEASVIKDRLGDNTYPEAMAFVPGVYATRTGGGAGDAALNLRGFKQDNIALLLNGIPVSSVENGLVYWNNWLGLAEVTRSLEVQKGICSSAFGVNAIGGAVNIITHGPEALPGGSASHSYTSYGNRKTTVAFNTGKLNSGWSISFMGSAFSGDGYIDGTYTAGAGYFLSASTHPRPGHLLVFTALGSPERHGQRNARLTSSEIRNYGITYNKEWGFYNGKINNTSENFYSKHYFTVNHYWNISKKAFLATSAYFLPGKGGGKWSEHYGTELSVNDFLNAGGQIDWEAIYAFNQLNSEPFTLPDGTSVSGYSRLIQTVFHADHQWSGWMSTLDYSLNQHLTIKAGMHFRYFKSSLYETVADLLGGGSFIDDYAWSLRGPDGRAMLKNPGDTLKVNNGALIHFVHGYAQATYDRNGFYAFFSGSVNINRYQRYDNYNYRPEEAWSEKVVLPGYDLRFGASKTLCKAHRIYLNGGYFNRVPYFKYVFGSYSNRISGALSNEKIGSVEAGYSFNGSVFFARINAYYTRWNDRSFLANEYDQFLDPVLVKGLNARHTGLEAEGTVRIRSITAGCVLAAGNYLWTNNVQAEVYNTHHVVTDTLQVYSKGLYVGDMPMFQLGGYVELPLAGFLSLRGDAMHYGRRYADFDPITRTDAGDTSQAWKMPDYTLVNVHVSGDFLLFKQQARFTLSLFNVLDAVYILRGVDGVDHTAAAFSGFWGFGRTLHAGIKVGF
ncbi:MAG: carboxypeptidase-like regulatory domain-containing protein [Bacteroidales bacterium]|nr:carboxypeptidase-like regulatory domain-containing protein [Bacteroidales bacterium]